MRDVERGVGARGGAVSYERALAGGQVQALESAVEERERHAGRVGWHLVPGLEHAREGEVAALAHQPSNIRARTAGVVVQGDIGVSRTGEVGRAAVGNVQRHVLATDPVADPVAVAVDERDAHTRVQNVRDVLQVAASVATAVDVALRTEARKNRGDGLRVVDRYAERALDPWLVQVALVVNGRVRAVVVGRHVVCIRNTVIRVEEGVGQTIHSCAGEARGCVATEVGRIVLEDRFTAGKHGGQTACVRLVVLIFEPSHGAVVPELNAVGVIEALSDEFSEPLRIQGSRW